MLKIIFLGGVGEIGKNMVALEYGDDILVIDCGSTFPDINMPGIDLVIPDPAYLLDNAEKVRGIVLTHGHEDHIGGLPYILKYLNVPVYGTKLTLAILDSKLREHKVDADLNVVKADSVVMLGKSFRVEFVNVSHSISGSCALSITTPIGIVFHTGDFKVDFTPIDGNVINLNRIAEIGRQGVLLLLAESTNIERPGYTMSEATVGKSLHNILADNPEKRIFIATFATNVHRLQQILDLAVKFKRKVVFTGRSMLNIADCAAKIGELHFAEDLVIDVDGVKNYEDKELLIVTTGSQGEAMSALSRMSTGDFNKIKLGYNDLVIISASPIPGNERMIYTVINNIYRHGAAVIYESLAEVHVSGHACREEMKLMHTLLKPKFFIPVHGEHRHQHKHAELAMQMGMKASNIIITDVGDVVEVTPKTISPGDKVTSGLLLVDGLGIGDVGSVVLRDRKYLSEEGVLVAAVSVDKESGAVNAVELTSRGFVYVNETENIQSEIEEVIYSALAKFDLKSLGDYSGVKNAVRKDIKNYVYKKIKRSPMIIVIVL
ncbi:MAG: ribonuclease J [Clostridia bacterium]|nr:ribonuclease J [Clostridia bacterium]